MAASSTSSSARAPSPADSAEHPALTAAELAANPTITAGLIELLDALGLTKEQQ